MKRPWRLAGIVFAVSACAQSSRPSFEVASVKVNTHCNIDDNRSGGSSSPGRIAMGCADLRDLILTAYGIYGNGANPGPGSFRMQVVGGPSWIDSTRYDIAAKPAGSPLRSEMYGPMMQSLLEDRFKLKVHRETKEGRVYLLTVAKNGPKLHATKDGTCVAADINHPREAGNLTPVCGKTNIRAGNPGVIANITGATIADLCAQLGMVMDHEVIDRTAIQGRFDMQLEYTPAERQPRFVAGRTIQEQDQLNDDHIATGLSISSALQQQLGLKLESGRGPVQVIVVDHIEPLTDN